MPSDTAQVFSFNVDLFVNLCMARDPCCLLTGFEAITCTFLFNFLCIYLHIVIFVQPVLFLLCLSLLMGLFSHFTLIPHLSGIWNTYIENPDLDSVIRTVLSGNIFRKPRKQTADII